MLLNGTPFAFVIDLAALASRREYLKLDKWLTDKIREHGVSGDLPSSRSQFYICVAELRISCSPFSGALCPSLHDFPQTALSFHTGRHGSRERPTEKRTASS